MLPTLLGLCEASDMSATDELKGRKLYDALIALKPPGMAETDWAIAAGMNRGFFSNLKAGEGSPRLSTIKKLLGEIGKTEADLDPAAPTAPKPRGRTPAKRSDDAEATDTVGIQQIDYAYGMGAAFNDSPVQVEVMQFPRMWVETITYSPPELLTWARGRGDSMAPTIYDGDLVMIDRSQKKVQEQDAIWAFMVGDVGSVKRLRVKGDRFIILSDNPTIPDDEEPQDFVTIIGRVVFVGAKK